MFDTITSILSWAVIGGAFAAADSRHHRRQRLLLPQPEAGQRPGARHTFQKLADASPRRSIRRHSSRQNRGFQLSDELSALGASLNTYSALDNNTVSMKALKPNLDKSLDLFADVVRRPTFDGNEFERVRAQWLARIEQEKAITSALRVRPVQREALPTWGIGAFAAVA